MPMNQTVTTDVVYLRFHGLEGMIQLLGRCAVRPEKPGATRR
jgi:hypothetical protein